MKKLYFILLICILLPIGLYPQDSYTSCLNNGLARWSIFVQNNDAYDAVELISYGDTIVNDIEYKKISGDNRYFYYSGDTNQDWINHEPYFSYNTPFLLRESEDASQLFILNTESGEERLICDLNLVVGDAFELYDFYSNTSKTIYVDSVYVRDGLKHVQLDYRNPHLLGSSKLIFIEGIISNAGFLYMEMTHGYEYLLNCFKNDILYYKEEGELECYPCGYIYTAMQENKENPLFDVFLSAGEIVLLFDNMSDRNISIYDISGSLIYSVQSNAKEQGIEKPGRGVFLIYIQDKGTTQTAVQKVIL